MHFFCRHCFYLCILFSSCASYAQSPESDVFILDMPAGDNPQTASDGQSEAMQRSPERLIKRASEALGLGRRASQTFRAFCYSAWSAVRHQYQNEVPSNLAARPMLAQVQVAGGHLGLTSGFSGDLMLSVQQRF